MREIYRKRDINSEKRREREREIEKDMEIGREEERERENLMFHQRGREHRVWRSSYYSIYWANCLCRPPAMAISSLV